MPAFHMEDLEDEAFIIRPIHTPGHTPEHTSYLVLVEGEPVALFSGGSLLVGSAGRPDLLGIARADSLARLQYLTVNRLAALGDDIGLYPTHGEGSFCTASGAGITTSTIGRERATSPVLAHPDEDSFVAGQMAALQPFPKYYAHMGPANLMGPEPLPRRRIPDLTAHEVRRMQDEGVLVVDARPRDRFADGHIPGSLGVELRDDFGTWVGWLERFNARMVLVIDSDQDADEAIVQLQRIGFDSVVGVLGGIDSWQLAGHPVDHLTTVSASDLYGAIEAGEQVLDVRAPVEWDSGHLGGTRHVYVPEMAAGIPAGVDPDRTVWLMCGSGYRAVIAGGLLRRHGLDVNVLSAGGYDEVRQVMATWEAVCDAPLVTQ